MKNHLVKTLLLSSLFFISACGVKGPLESPQSAVKKAETNTAAPAKEATKKSAASAEPIVAKTMVKQAEDAAKNVKQTQ